MVFHLKMGRFDDAIKCDQSRGYKRGQQDDYLDVFLFEIVVNLYSEKSVVNCTVENQNRYSIIVRTVVE